MKHIKGTCFVFWVFLVGFFASQATARDVLPILKAGSQTYTNVEVLEVSDTRLFFQYPGGISCVKLKDLDPEMQKTFGYNPANEKQTTVVSAQETISETEDRTNSAPMGMAFKNYRLSDGRFLRLCLPKMWTSVVKESPDAPDIFLIRLEHPFEKDFSASVTVMPKKNPFANMSTEDATALPGYHELKTAVEKTLVIYSLDGPETKGNFYALTRQSPGKRPACKSEGVARIGDLTLGFIIESNDWKGKEPQAALDMVRMAQLLEPSPDKP